MLRGRRGTLIFSALDSEASGRVRALADDIVLCSWASNFLQCLTSLSSLVASSYCNRDKLRPDEPHGSYAIFFSLIVKKAMEAKLCLVLMLFILGSEPYRTSSNPKKQAEQSVGSLFQATAKRCVLLSIVLLLCLLLGWTQPEISIFS